MTPSSCKALAAASGLLALSALLYVTAKDTPAPPLSHEVTTELLTSVARSIHARDVPSLLSVTTNSSELFGMRRERAEFAIRRAMREAAGARLDLTWRNLEVRPSPSGAGIAEFDAVLSEMIGHTRAVYLETHVVLRLVKTPTTRWFGLWTEEEWRIDSASSAMDLLTGD